MDHFMNPSYGAMMGQGEGSREQDEGLAAKKEEGKRAAHDKPPHIHIHSHDKGHTVHIMHHDGTHEKHEHAPGDVDGIAAHLHEHLGSGEETGEMGASPGGAESEY